MYQRSIRLKSDMPETRLPALTVGQGSAFDLYISNVPSNATHVRFNIDMRVFDGTMIAANFSGVTTMDEGVWHIHIPANYFSDVIDYTYHVWVMINNEPYWSSSGTLHIVDTDADDEWALVVNGRAVAKINNAELASIGDAERDEANMFLVDYLYRLTKITPENTSALKVGFADCGAITEDGRYMVTFEVMLDFSERVPASVTFGEVDAVGQFTAANVKWIGATPELLTQKKHLLAFRWMDGALFGSKQGEW